MIITIRCIKKYGKCRAEFASAVLIAAESKFITTAGQCTSQYALSTLTMYNGNGRAEFASAGFISDVPLNILLNHYLSFTLPSFA